MSWRGLSPLGGGSGAGRVPGEVSDRAGFSPEDARPLSPGCVAGEAAALVLVAVLWGSTGPLLRRGAAGLEEVRRRGRLQQLLAEIRFLGLNYKVRPGLGSWAAG